MSLCHILSDKLKEIRKTRVLTQSQIAYGIGVSRSAVASWEAGMREPNTSELMDICRFFNVTPEYMCGISEECTITNIPRIYNIDFSKLNTLGKQTLCEMYNFLVQNDLYKK